MKKITIYIKKTWLLLFLFFVTLNTYAQVDSLINELKRAEHDTDKITLMLVIARQQLSGNMKEAQDYTEQALAIAKTNNYRNRQDDAYDMLGIICTIKGDYDQALKNYAVAIQINKELNNQIGLAKTYGNLCALYQYKGDIEKAMKAQTESLKISEQLGNKRETATSLNNLGNINSNLGNFERAKENYLRAIQLKKELNAVNEPEMARIYNNLAIVVYQNGKGNIDSAIAYIERAMEISRMINEDIILAESLNLMGQFHHEVGDFELAKKDHLQALPIFEKSGHEYELKTLYMLLGEDYLALVRYDSAAYYFQKILNSKVTDDKHSLDLYVDLTKLFIKTGQQDSALFYFDKMFALKNKMTDKEKMEIIERTQTEYETEKLKREKAEAKKNIIAVEKSRLWLLIICFISIGGIIILLLYLRQRKIKEQKSKIELEQKALRSQMNPHFIFNSLNAIQDMYVGGEMELANDYMGDFSELMRKILDNSGKNKITVKEEIDTLHLYLEMEKLRSGGLLKYDIRVDENIDQLNTYMPPLVIQPFVENAVWHGILAKKEKGKVEVKLKMMNKKLICTIEDDGIGYEKSISSKHLVNHDSKGMKLTEQRLGERIKIEELHPGTRITLSIPI